MDDACHPAAVILLVIPISTWDWRLADRSNPTWNPETTAGSGSAAVLDSCNVFPPTEFSAVSSNFHPYTTEVELWSRGHEKWIDIPTFLIFEIPKDCDVPASFLLLNWLVYRVEKMTGDLADPLSSAHSAVLQKSVFDTSDKVVIRGWVQLSGAVLTFSKVTNDQLMKIIFMKERTSLKERASSHLCLHYCPLDFKPQMSV